MKQLRRPDVATATKFAREGLMSMANALPGKCTVCCGCGNVVGPCDDDVDDDVRISQT